MRANGRQREKKSQRNKVIGRGSERQKKLFSFGAKLLYQHHSVTSSITQSLTFFLFALKVSFQFAIHSVIQFDIFALQSRIELCKENFIRFKIYGLIFVSYCSLFFLLSFCLYICMSVCLFLCLSASFLISHLLRSFGQFVLVVI